MTSTPARIGAACWTLANVVFFTTHAVVQSAWSRPYSWAHNNISDLGNVTCGPWGDDRRYVCSPLHDWMNAAIVISGILLAAGVVLLRRHWGGAISGPVLLVTATAGWVLVGLVPADVNENLHVLGAVLIFGTSNIGLVLTARRGWPGALRRLAVVAGGLGLVAMVLHFSGHYVGLGMGGTERVTAFAMPLWMAAAGVALLFRRPATDGVHNGRQHTML